MNFGMIILNQNIKAMQNYAIWILTVLLFILKPNIFIKILHCRWNYEADRPLPKGICKKVVGLINDELAVKIIEQFVVLRPKTYSYLTDDDKNVKKSTGTKSVK